MSEKLIGFDSREMYKNFRDTWDEPRRKLYLLNETISKPLSVDKNVWEKATEAKNPNIFGLWEDLPLLKLKSNKLNFDLWLIAITVLLDKEQGGKPILDSVNVNPGSIQNLPAEFLGYDIADDALTSGLMNCGYPDSEAKAGWGEKINKYHLINSKEDAIKFRIFSDKRVPEHVPFNVYGIYKLK